MITSCVAAASLNVVLELALWVGTLLDGGTCFALPARAASRSSTTVSRELKAASESATVGCVTGGSEWVQRVAANIAPPPKAPTKADARMNSIEARTTVEPSGIEGVESRVESSGIGHCACNSELPAQEGRF